MAGQERTRIYENTNLAESYSGAITPLTASFAQDVYEGVYRHFASFMGVSKADAKRNDGIFSRMVVVIGYHLYYDLDSWYTLVRMLPGYQYNKPFFEQMLGVKADDRCETDTTPSPTRLGQVWAKAKLGYQILKIALILLCMPLLVWWFNQRFDASYRRFMAMDVNKMSEAELVAHYQTVRDRLVKLWRTPIANDFGVMVSAGILRALSGKWGVDADYIEALESRSRARLATLDPGRELLRLVESITSDEQMRDIVFSDRGPEEVYVELESEHGSHPVTIAVREYIERYGSRVPSELKLETETLAEVPADAIRLVRTVAAANQTELSERLRMGAATKDSDTVTAMPVGLRWWQRVVFRVVHRWARTSIRYREATRLRRSQIFGHARQTFLALGRQLQEQGRLEDPRDILFLTIPEIRALDTETGLSARVSQRRVEYAQWQTRQLEHRYETTDPIARLEERIKSASPKTTVNTGTLQGTVASTGALEVVSGEVVVVRTFDQGIDYRDKILVTSFTDPGWTMVFSLVKAIVVERGGLLSHASIVAREMHVPCLIGVEGATERLRTGERVTLDLRTGVIRSS